MITYYVVHHLIIVLYVLRNIFRRTKLYFVKQIEYANYMSN